MTHGYAKEKLGSTIHSLATDPSDIRQRIWHAFLVFHTLTEKDFPLDLQESWNRLRRSLNTEAETYNSQGEITEGLVQNILKVLSDHDCVKIAEQIVELESRLEEY